MRRRRGALAAAIGLLVLAVAAVRGRLRRYAIAEQSMLPALAPGDWIVAKQVSSVTRRGSIIVFPYPGPGDIEIVKRVVGLPGETVTIANGQVHVDGEILAEPWADGPTRPDGEWKLGDDQLFVLSDSRSISTTDSRSFGPIDVSTARWRIIGRYWPPQAFGRL
jgi:signal peptidase I